ncbi:ABC transporter permease [Streptomyces sp. NPDC051567]|uniref:ABC transporter permease n=1 Tax=Streptomyces sp. NPDC051567 TaxID=3365660 RepID=UPI00379DD9E7
MSHGERSTLRIWARDLGMGVRFACGGGREGWTRTLLTGVGVGLGVALLLITTSLPGALGARADRRDARSTAHSPTAEAPGRDTLLIAPVDQTYRDRGVDGSFVRAEGPDAPLPPGLTSIPAPGEMAVSPALRTLLGSPEGALLRERLDGRITQVIGDTGLVGPGDLLFYYGKGDLRQLSGDDHRVRRVTGFADTEEADALDPVLMLLVLLTFVALLTPVAVFIAAAVRFGGERRDRRLAALRLIGADGRTVRRIAAGEAAAGAVAGLVLGAGFFLVCRGLVTDFVLQQRSVFPADLNPAPWLAVLVAVGVPAAAVAVTLFTLRGVIIEPLGVVRTTRPVRRRGWWRLVMPVAGLGLLAPLAGRGNEGGAFNQVQVSAGVVLLLVGITALLPWLLERIVSGLSGGPVSWQLAVRRLQVDSGGAARLVNGIAVAVAGAIALQMMFAGVEANYTEETGQDPDRAALSIIALRQDIEGDPAAMERLGRKIASAKGVTKAVPLLHTDVAPRPVETGQSIPLTIGGCEALREIAVLDSCEDGDAFVLNRVPGNKESSGPGSAAPGDRLFAGTLSSDDPQDRPVPWTLPADARKVSPRKDPNGNLEGGLLATPSAAPKGIGRSGFANVLVQIDPAVPDALDRARNAAFAADPYATAMTLTPTRLDSTYAAIRVGLSFASVAVLVLIGSSLLVSQLEQLRERRRLIAALVAFGTRRSTLSLSVLWQTALPIGLGLGLAMIVGLGLGSVLLRMTGNPVAVDWTSVLTMTGAGAGVVAAVTLLSLPLLLRLMRPDGLRTE